LKVQHREGDEVLDGELTCAQCGQAFAISSGIPRFVPRLSQETSQTTEGFGYEWNTFNEAIKGGNMSAEFLFLDFISPVAADFFQDKVVLDGGCGMGRFSMQAAKWGAREVIAVDLGPAVEAAYHNTRSLPNVHVIQADLCALPLKAAFDYVFSVGVLHHLADPKRGFVQISRLLKPRGHLSAWVYAREGNEWVERFITPFRKHVTSRMPKALLLGLSYVLGVILYGGIKLIYTPVNRLNALRWLRRRMFYNDYLYYLGSVGFSGVVSVIFDQLVPSLAAYVPKEDLVDWISSARLECLSITSRTNNSWRLLARNSAAIAPTANEQ
jgi:SAM-dependent methyltransferase